VVSPLAITLEDLELDPHPTLARLREHEPVAWVPALNGWLITRRDLALAAMRDAATFTVDDPRFSTGRVVGRSMLTVEGAEHDRHRAPFARTFRLQEVRERFTDVVATETDRLIDALEPAGRGDLRRQIASPLAARIVTHALGIPDADRALGWYAAIVHATTELARGAEEVTAEARAAVKELRSAVSGDASDVATLLFGGIETTEGMIANAVLHLLQHPDQRERLRADPTLTANAIEESLRLEPAAATIDRYATRDTEFGGCGAHIRRGDLVTISIAAANRDPSTFPEPDRFDITRENAKQHLAFAHGPHVCIGMHLARLEAHTAVARLLERLPRLKLDPDRPSAPRGLVFRKPESLHVLWDPPGAPTRPRVATSPP
jgi:cytochrome P450